MMDLTIKNKILLFLGLVLYSCASQKIKDIEPKLVDWNKICLDSFRNRYNNYYREFYKSSCEFENNRDMFFDYNRKIIRIEEYKFNSHLKLLLSKLKSLNKVDSIIAINIFNPITDEVEFPFFTTDYLVYFKNKDIVPCHVNESFEKLSFSKESLDIKWYNCWRLKKDSCELGLIVITNIKSNLNINNIKIIINPTNINSMENNSD